MTREQEIGLNIKKARANKEMSQKELATAIGKSIRSISEYERGAICPPFETINQIADVLDTTEAALLGYEHGEPMSTLADLLTAVHQLTEKQEICFSIKETPEEVALVFSSDRDHPKSDYAVQMLKDFLAEWIRYETGFDSITVYENWIRKQEEMYSCHRLKDRSRPRLSKAERVVKYKEIDSIYRSLLSEFCKENGEGTEADTIALKQEAIQTYQLEVWS